MSYLRSLALVLLLALTAACSNATATTEGNTPAGVSATATESPETPPPSVTSASTRDTPLPPTDTAGVTPTSEAEERPFESPEYGVQAFLWWRPDIAARDLELIDGLGFGWVKQTFAWRDIETNEKGQYDWWKPDKVVQQVEDADLKLLVRLDRQPFWSQEEPYPPLENAPPADLQDFADFCGDVASRYQGRIAAYQVWNEPNLTREWGMEAPDPGAYTELLKVCNEAVNAADPEAVVNAAGLSPTGVGPPEAIDDTTYLQGMYDAGAAEYFDVLGVNAPGYAAPPEM